MIVLEKEEELSRRVDQSVSWVSLDESAGDIIDMLSYSREALYRLTRNGLYYPSGLVELGSCSVKDCLLFNFRFATSFSPSIGVVVFSSLLRPSTPIQSLCQQQLFLAVSKETLMVWALPLVCLAGDTTCAFLIVLPMVASISFLSPSEQLLISQLWLYRYFFSTLSDSVSFLLYFRKASCSSLAKVRTKITILNRLRACCPMSW